MERLEPDGTRGWFVPLGGPSASIQSVAIGRNVTVGGHENHVLMNDDVLNDSGSVTKLSANFLAELDPSGAYVKSGCLRARVKR